MNRTITLIVGLLVAVSAGTPASASASSLLSGYGGPGQGNQAILGSALLNGPPGGAADSGGSGSSNNATSLAAAGESASHAPKRSTGRGQAGRVRRSRDQSRTAPARATDAYPVAERDSGAQGAGSLGVSGADLLYIVLALGILAFAGVLTGRLTANDRRRRALAAKEMPRGDRVTG